MPSTIVSETIGGIEDRRVALKASSIVRPHGLGTSWNVLRVGLRVQIENQGTSLPGGRIFLGLCSGTANPFGSKTPTNCFGYYHGLQWGLAIGSGMTRYVQGNSTGTFTVKNVGGVQTLSAGINDGQTAYWSADPTSATRRMLFADIIKGSPNYSINMFYCNTAASGNDALDTDFRTQVLLASPSFTNHQFTAGVGALAFDQVAGVLDCVNVTWELYSVRFHICDLAAVVIS